MKGRDRNPSPLCGGGWRAERVGRGSGCRTRPLSRRPSGGPPPRRGGRVFWALDRCQYLIHDELRVAEERVVREAEDVEALLAEKSIAVQVTTPLVLIFMRRPIELDDQAGPIAKKIDDIGRDRDLALELVAVQAPGANLLPEQILGAREHGPLPIGE
jgi:hypothetical protein